jgi:hypothetical protein
MMVVFRYRDVRQRKARRSYLPLPAVLQTLLPARYDEGDTFYPLAGGASHQGFFSILEGSMNHGVPVVPSDTQDLPCGSKGLSFVNSGSQTLHVTFVGGEDCPGIIVPGGLYPYNVKRVWATGTTVTNIFTYWT